MNTFGIRKRNEKRKRYVKYYNAEEFKFLSCGFGTGMVEREKSYFSLTSNTMRHDFRLEVDLQTAKQIYDRLQTYFNDKIVNPNGVEGYSK